MVGTEIALQLADYILSHASVDDDIERLVKGYSIHILPAVNRDGTVLAQPGNCSAKGGKCIIELLRQNKVHLSIGYFCKTYHKYI